MATETLVPTSAPTIETEALSIISQVDDYPHSSAPAVSFPDFLTGLLKSLLSGENQLACPLPPEFCAALLHTDDVGAPDEGEEVVLSPKGVPKYPLYKYIAGGLSEWTLTGCFPRTVEPVEGISEDGGIFATIERWTQKVVQLGGLLKELSQGVRFQIHCQEPYFSQLKDGMKTVEGRCATGNYSKVQVGDSLLVNQSLLLIVEDVKRYTTFKEMLEIEGLSSVLPGVILVTEGVKVYRNFYSEAREKEAGVVGIHVRHRVHRRQPFELLHDLLKELHVEGIRALGMRSTMGSAKIANQNFTKKRDVDSIDNFHTSFP